MILEEKPINSEGYADDRVRVITLSGDLGCSGAAGLAERLMTALGDADFLLLRMEDIGAVEAECLSQICTAYQLALRLKKKIIITGDVQKIRGYVQAERTAVCAFPMLSVCADECIWRTAGSRMKP